MKRTLFGFLAALVLSACAFGQSSGFITSNQCVTIPATGATTGGYGVSGTWTGTLQAFGIVGQGTPASLGTQTANGSFTVTVSGYTLFEVCGNTVATGAAFVQLTAPVNSGSSSSGSGLPAGCTGTSGQITCSLFATNNSNGGIQMSEGTCGNLTPAAGQDFICANSAAHAIQFSLNGNSFVTVPTSSSSPQQFLGSCGNGVLGSASTIGVGFMGANINVGCAGSYTSNAALPVLQACTINSDGKFRFTSSAAGVNASDGVVTLNKNGTNTTITCTVGTGTSCTDNAHTVSAVAGDRLSVQVVTQTSTTLANPEVGFTCQ